MTDESQGGRKGLRTVALLAGTGISVLHLHAARAAGAADTPANQNALEQVTVFGRKDAYKIDTSGLSKLAVPLLDVAQSINTVSQQEMQDRAVVDLNNAPKDTRWGVVLAT
jgi:outer membrane receptor for monomeric catechols